MPVDRRALLEEAIRTVLDQNREYLMPNAAPGEWEAKRAQAMAEAREALRRYPPVAADGMLDITPALEGIATAEGLSADECERMKLQALDTIRQVNIEAARLEQEIMDQAERSARAKWLQRISQPLVARITRQRYSTGGRE